MSRLPSLNGLRAFVAAVDTGSLTAAARLVYRSQSAVSMQIKSLEVSLGKPLFLRKPRNITLTQDGQVVTIHAEELQVFPRPSDLPTADDVRGILR